MEEETFVYYVGVDFRIYKISLSTGATTPAFKETEAPPESVISIAVSQDGKRLAYLKVSCNAGELIYDNSIYIRDIEVKTANTDTTNTADTSDNADTTDSANTTDTADNSGPPVVPYEQFGIQPYNDAWGIGHIESLAFDYSGTKLVFDVNNCPLTDGICGTGLAFWSIGILDLTDGSIKYPVSDQNESVDLRYPSFAYNNNYVLVMDYHDRNTGNTIADVKTYNLMFESKTFIQVASLGEGELWGMPSFWGDDKYVTIQKRTEDGDVSIYRVPINEDLSGDSANLKSLNEYDAVLPVMHRKAVRSMSVELVVDSALLTDSDLLVDSNVLDFGHLDPGEENVFRVKIKNSGNVDTEINSITLSNNAFTHNGVTTFLPKDQSVTLDIGFVAGANVGTQMGELTFSYGFGNDLTISLIATVGKDFKRAVLKTSEAALNFGQLLVNEKKSMTFEISNQGDEGAVITAIELTNIIKEKKFSHDAHKDMIVPAHGKIAVKVEYAADDTFGTQTDSLVFHHGINNTVTVLLSARTVKEIITEAGSVDDGVAADATTSNENTSPAGTRIGGGTDGSAGLSSVSYFLVLLLALRIMFNPKMRRYY